MSKLLKGALGAVIGVALGMAGTGTSSASALDDRPGYPCDPWTFCAWDETGPNPPTLLFTRGGTIGCGATFELAAPARNSFGSINNRTSGTWQLKDGTKVVFTATETAWGNLPPEAQNNVDNMRFICT
jgi:hypothetical protein